MSFSFLNLIFLHIGFFLRRHTSLLLLILNRRVNFLRRPIKFEKYKPRNIILWVVQPLTHKQLTEPLSCQIPDIVIHISQLPQQQLSEILVSLKHK